MEIGFAPVALSSKIVGLVMSLAKLADDNSVIHALDSLRHLRPIGAIWQSKCVLCFPLLLGKLKVGALFALRKQLRMRTSREIGV